MRVWMVALLVPLIMLTSGCEICAQQGPYDFLLDIYSGEFAERGGYIGGELMYQIIEDFPEIAPNLIYCGIEVDPHWVTHYYDPQDYISHGTLRTLTTYAKEMWILGHLEGCEILRGGLTLPDLYELRPGFLPHQVNDIKDDWTMFLASVMGMEFDILTRQWHKPAITLKQNLLIGRVQGFSSVAGDETTFGDWLWQRRELLETLVGERGFLQLQVSCGDLVYGDLQLDVLEARWLWLLMTEVVEYADSPRTYQKWLEMYQEDIVLLIGYVGFDALHAYSNILIDTKYPCTRSGEWVSYPNPIRAILDGFL